MSIAMDLQAVLGAPSPIVRLLTDPQVLNHLRPRLTGIQLRWVASLAASASEVTTSQEVACAARFDHSIFHEREAANR